MNDEVIRLITKNIATTMDQNKKEIAIYLGEGIPQDSGFSPEMADVIVKSIFLSTEISVQMTLKMLESAGAIKFREDFCMKPDIRLVYSKDDKKKVEIKDE